MALKGHDSPDVAKSYLGIGNVYDSQGQYEQALEYYQKALEINIKVSGKDHLDVAKSYTGIGNVYRVPEKARGGARKSVTPNRSKSRPGSLVATTTYRWAPLTSRPASTVCCASNLLAYHELCSAAAVRWEWRSLIEASLGLMTRLDFAVAAGPSWNLFSTCAAGLDDVQAALRRCGNLTELDLSRTAGLADTVDRAGQLLIKT